MDTNAFFNTPADEMGAAVAGEVVKPAKATNSNNELKEKMQSEFNKAVTEDPSLMSVMKSESKNLCVLNSLGSSKLSNFVQDKAQPTKLNDKGQEVRNLVQTSGICGYRLQNIGDKPITYMTMEYQKDENGIYVGTEVEKTAAPGEQFDLARKYFTMLTSRPEYSFLLANGRVVTGKSIAKCTTLDEKLERPHFDFYQEEGKPSVSVHDDGIKIPVDDADGVKPEFQLLFGYLDNPTTAKSSSRSGGRKTVSAQELAANYFQSLINGKVAD
jgi:hypothetical protein